MRTDNFFMQGGESWGNMRQSRSYYTLDEEIHCLARTKTILVKESLLTMIPCDAKFAFRIF